MEGRMAKRLRKAKRLSESELQQELIRLRREARKEIERLIDLLDRTETYDSRSGGIGYYDEREPRVADDEPSLGGGDGRDLEGDYADDEPSLGWPERVCQREEDWGGQNDREQCVPVGSATAYRRYRDSNRWAPNNDGQHVDAEVSFNHRRIRNLSDRQREILSPKVNRSEVSV
jgi:hypothetical protein